MPVPTTPAPAIPNEPLTEAQSRVISKLHNQHGIVAAHGVGTGKTRLSIEAYKSLGLPAHVVAPAALKGNYRKELDKWVGHQPNNVKIDSQQAVARGGLNTPGGGFMVVDEAHRARETSSKLLDALKKNQAQKVLLLTGSPVYNKPSDVAPLVNLAAGKKILPDNPAHFYQKYVEQRQVKPSLMGRLMGVKPGIEESLNPKPDLVKALGKYVDYKEGQKEGFPSHKEQHINVPMDPKQVEIYNTIMDKAPMWVRWKVKAGLPPNKQELGKLQAFLTGARQVSNSTYDFVNDKSQYVAPKVTSAANYLKQQIEQNPRYKGVIYSNYLGSGLEPYKRQLTKFNIPYGEFSGDVDPKLRDQLVKDYNANKLRALLISSAGAEGLDLKGTRLLQILEPHFNTEKEKQIVGRAIRYKSHAALPEHEQNVLIQRYFSRPKGSWLDRMTGKDTVQGTDEYIYNIAQRKQKLNDQLLNILRNQERNGNR